MEFIKAVETRNFRVICEHANPDKFPPSPQDQVTVKFYGNSDDGLRFCASKDALAMVPPAASGKGLPTIIRAYETVLPVAKQFGFLNTDEINNRLKDRTATINAQTPTPLYKNNPMDNLRIPDGKRISVKSPLAGNVTGYNLNASPATTPTTENPNGKATPPPATPNPVPTAPIEPNGPSAA